MPPIWRIRAERKGEKGKGKKGREAQSRAIKFLESGKRRFVSSELHRGTLPCDL